jgi:Family of unknown function (DUF5992)
LKTAICRAFIAFVILYSSLSVAGDFKGKISKVFNAAYAQDNFAVTMKPGWTGTGCSGNTNGNLEVTIPFFPANVGGNINTFQRQYAAALAAVVNDNTVTVVAHSNCQAFSIEIRSN